MLAWRDYGLCLPFERSRPMQLDPYVGSALADRSIYLAAQVRISLHERRVVPS
jgi:hypothetical protein